jgi:hypothetical protein
MVCAAAVGRAVERAAPVEQARVRVIPVAICAEAMQHMVAPRAGPTASQGIDVWSVLEAREFHRLRACRDDGAAGE